MCDCKYHYFISIAEGGQSDEDESCSISDHKEYSDSKDHKFQHDLNELNFNHIY